MSDQITKIPHRDYSADSIEELIEALRQDGWCRISWQKKPSCLFLRYCLDSDDEPYDISRRLQQALAKGKKTSIRVWLEVVGGKITLKGESPSLSAF